MILERDNFDFEPARLPFVWDDNGEFGSRLWVGSTPFGMVIQNRERWVVINARGDTIAATPKRGAAMWTLEFNVAASLWGAATPAQLPSHP